MRPFTRTCALVLATGSLAGLACSDPEFNTDLDTEGAPEVTMVTVLSESSNAPLAFTAMEFEPPTFCINGEGIKVNTQLCPESEDEPGKRDVAPVMDAQPEGWHLRLVFSELLDPDIERLERIEVDDDGDGNTDRVQSVGHLDESQPVTVTCGGAEVAYDGFYDPSGNDVTLPPGPALVIQPTDFVATGSTCTVTVKPVVTDKEGNAVADQALMGPHTFGVAAMAPQGTSPSDGSEGVDPALAVEIPFNAPIDPTTLTTAGTFTFVDAAGADVAFTAALKVIPPEEEGGESVTVNNVVALTPAAPLAQGVQHTVTMVAAANPIKDIAGGALTLADDLTFNFTTAVAE